MWSQLRVGQSELIGTEITFETAAFVETTPDPFISAPK